MLARGVHEELYVRVIGEKLRDERVEAVVLDRRHRDADFTADRARAVLHALFGAVDGGEDAARVRVERLARVRERELARRPLQEAHVEALFEPREASADRRARDAELGRGARERRELDGAGEREQLGGLHRLHHMDQKVAYASRW